MGALAPFFLVIPAIAEVQDGTYDLLHTVEQTLTVDYNPSKCSRQNIDGSYNLDTRTITLCYDGEVDANDHDTVRHEVWHAIQHCLTPKHHDGLRPVVSTDDPDWMQAVGQHLSVAQMASIRDNYPKFAWEAEYEAHSVANSLTAKQIQRLFVKACA